MDRSDPSKGQVLAAKVPRAASLDRRQHWARRTGKKRLYACLETEDYSYAIRLKANANAAWHRGNTRITGKRSEMLRKLHIAFSNYYYRAIQIGSGIVSFDRAVFRTL
jgi:hypothetical protein